MGCACSYFSLNLLQIFSFAFVYFFNGFLFPKCGSALLTVLHLGPILAREFWSGRIIRIIAFVLSCYLHVQLVASFTFSFQSLVR